MVSKMLAAFQEVGDHHLVEASFNGYWDVVDGVLDGFLLQRVAAAAHLGGVGVGDFGWVEPQLAVGFEVDKLGGSVVEGEIQLLCFIIGMEKQHLVFVVPQVAQGVEQGVPVVLLYEGVGEKHHH